MSTPCSLPIGWTDARTGGRLSHLPFRNSSHTLLVIIQSTPPRLALQIPNRYLSKTTNHHGKNTARPET